MEVDWRVAGKMVVCASLGLAGLAGVGTIGRERKPITPTDGVVNVIATTLLILTVWNL